jgi:hypothetical protein
LLLLVGEGVIQNGMRLSGSSAWLRMDLIFKIEMNLLVVVGFVLLARRIAGEPKQA